MPTVLTFAQFETLSALQSWGIGTGDTFTAQEVFPDHDNESLGHRRTLRTLARKGFLAPLPQGRYRLEPGTYEQAGRDSTVHLWHERP